MSTTSTFTVPNGGLPLNCVEWGDPAGVPVVLLHGLRAYAQWFEEFADLSGGAYRLIGLDQRGRGDSAWDPQGRYDTDSYVADIAAVAKHLGLKRFFLIGHSMGGTNALNYAATYPAQVIGLVIAESSPVLSPQGLTRIRSEMGRTPKRFDDAEEALAFLRSLHTRASERSLKTRLDRMLKPAEEGGLTWRIDPAIFDPRMTPDPAERSWSALRRVQCPTLVIRALLSDLMSAEIADEMAAALAHGERADVEQAAHMVAEDNPHGFTDAVMPFLDKVSKASA